MNWQRADAGQVTCGPLLVLPCSEYRREIRCADNVGPLRMQFWRREREYCHSHREGFLKQVEFNVEMTVQLPDQFWASVALDRAAPPRTQFGCQNRECVRRLQGTNPGRAAREQQLSCGARRPAARGSDGIRNAWKRECAEREVGDSA